MAACVWLPFRLNSARGSLRHASTSRMRSPAPESRFSTPARRPVPSRPAPASRLPRRTRSRSRLRPASLGRAPRQQRAGEPGEPGAIGRIKHRTRARKDAHGHDGDGRALGHQEHDPVRQHLAVRDGAGAARWWDQQRQEEDDDGEAAGARAHEKRGSATRLSNSSLCTRSSYPIWRKTSARLAYRSMPSGARDEDADVLPVVGEVRAGHALDVGGRDGAQALEELVLPA